MKQKIRIRHVETDEGCDLIIDLPTSESTLIVDEPTAAQGPSNDELIAAIIKTYLRSTRNQRVELWNTWQNIPLQQREQALVGGNAGDGGLAGAFTLNVPDVSSLAYATFGASLAVLARHSRSESGPFTHEHYEVLTRPWRRVFGAVRPDDDLPTGNAVK